MNAAYACQSIHFLHVSFDRLMHFSFFGSCRGVAKVTVGPAGEASRAAARAAEAEEAAVVAAAGSREAQDALQAAKDGKDKKVARMRQDA